MKMWKKFKLCAHSLLVMTMASFGVCSCNNEPNPTVSSITPNVGDQGTDVPVTITGTQFSAGGNRRPIIRIDGNTNYGVTTSYNSKCDVIDHTCDPYGDTTIDLTLHIDANATAGFHSIAIVTVDTDLAGELPNLISTWQSFYVHCSGCPLPPQFWKLITQPENTPLIPGGAPVTFRFIGKNFLNNNPRVQIDGNGVVPDSAPPIVQQSGDLDYFDLPIRAASYAASDLYNVTIVTPGGPSNPLQLIVDASPLRPTPVPGGLPVLDRITPSRLTKNSCFSCGAWVGFKCEGSGFGNNPEIIIENSSLSPIMQYPYHANPDRVAVAMMLLPANFAEPSVTVKVRNANNNFTSDGLPLALDQSEQDAPAAEGLPYGGVRQGGEADITIYGRHLEDVWGISGISGLRFRDIQAFADHVSFHVIADTDAPVTGDDVTNLTFGTSHGDSNQFNFPIDPP